jgi:hypothetical protein
MLKIAVVTLSAGLLMLHLQAPALASDKDEPLRPGLEIEVLCSGADAAEREYCMALRMLGKPRCTGSVEERLTCLETQIREQELELSWLRSRLRRMGQPRIHPLDGFSPNEPDRTAR